MAQDPRGQRDEQSPKPRIVQYRNRRYSVRLEPIYWRNLERIAERRQYRLGRLIATLAEEHKGGNFSSFLRVYCMLEAERAFAARHLGTPLTGLMDVLASCPAPGLILSRHRTIVSYNDAFGDWLGPVDLSVIGSNLTSLLQVRTAKSLNEVWEAMILGQESRLSARVLYVAPGRVNAAQANLLALHAAGGTEFYAVMWLAFGKPKAVAARPWQRGPAE
jgi:predicted DNA-binding ribbon-helix-helix protein